MHKPVLECLVSNDVYILLTRGPIYDKLTIILRLSYDYAKVTIDLRRTSNLHPTNGARLFLGMIHLQSCNKYRKQQQYV